MNDGYLDGLKEALDIVVEMSKSQPKPRWWQTSATYHRTLALRDVGCAISERIEKRANKIMDKGAVSGGS